MPPRQILVIDDDVDIRHSVREVLEDAGYAVAVACNGREALDRMVSGEIQPEVILLDLMMPVMDGPAFMAELRLLPAAESISVIVFSAHSHMKDVLAELNVAGFLRKPVRRTELIKAIASTRE